VLIALIVSIVLTNLVFGSYDVKPTCIVSLLLEARFCNRKHLTVTLMTRPLAKDGCHKSEAKVETCMFRGISWILSMARRTISHSQRTWLLRMRAYDGRCWHWGQPHMCISSIIRDHVLIALTNPRLIKSQHPQTPPCLRPTKCTINLRAKAQESAYLTNLQYSSSGSGSSSNIVTNITSSINLVLNNYIWLLHF
jgi:hypothetical protein